MGDCPTPWPARHLCSTDTISMTRYTVLLRTYSFSETPSGTGAQRKWSPPVQTVVIPR